MHVIRNHEGGIKLGDKSYLRFVPGTSFNVMISRTEKLKYQSSALTWWAFYHSSGGAQYPLRRSSGKRI